MFELHPNHSSCQLYTHSLNNLDTAVVSILARMLFVYMKD